MRNPSIIVISAMLLVIGGIFRIIESSVGPNIGTIFQLIGTLLITAAVGLLVIRSLQIIRQRTSPTKKGPNPVFDSAY